MDKSNRTNRIASLEALAQNYGAGNYLRQYLAPGGLKRSLFETVSGTFEDKMEQLRIADKEMRAIANGSTGIKFKEAVKEAEKAFKDMRYLDMAHYINLTNKAVKDMVGLGQHVGYSDEEINEEYTRTDVADPHEDYFGEDQEKIAYVFESQLVKSAGFFDWVSRKVDGNILERTYRTKIKARKAGVQMLLGEFKTFVNQILKCFEAMGKHRAYGNISEWRDEVSRMDKLQKAFETKFKVSYDKNFKDLAEIARRINPKAESPISSGPSETVNMAIPEAPGQTESLDPIHVIEDIKEEKADMRSEYSQSEVVPDEANETKIEHSQIESPKFEISKETSNYPESKPIGRPQKSDGVEMIENMLTMHGIKFPQHATKEILEKILYENEHILFGKKVEEAAKENEEPSLNTEEVVKILDDGEKGEKAIEELISTYPAQLEVIIEEPEIDNNISIQEKKAPKAKRTKSDSRKSKKELKSVPKTLEEVKILETKVPETKLQEQKMPIPDRTFLAPVEKVEKSAPVIHTQKQDKKETNVVLGTENEVLTPEFNNLLERMRELTGVQTVGLVTPDHMNPETESGKKFKAIKEDRGIKRNLYQYSDALKAFPDPNDISSDNSSQNDKKEAEFKFDKSQTTLIIILSDKEPEDLDDRKIKKDELITEEKPMRYNDPKFGALVQKIREYFKNKPIEVRSFNPNEERTKKDIAKLEKDGYKSIKKWNYQKAKDYLDNIKNEIKKANYTFFKGISKLTNKYAIASALLDYADEIEKFDIKLADKLTHKASQIIG